MKKALHHLIFLLASVLLLATMGCNTEPKTGIVWLEDYVQNELLDDFISEFSQYEFYQRENLFPQMSICFFSFNHELIDGDDKNGGQYVK